MLLRSGTAGIPDMSVRVAVRSDWQGAGRLIQIDESVEEQNSRQLILS